MTEYSKFFSILRLFSLFLSVSIKFSIYFWIYYVKNADLFAFRLTICTFKYFKSENIAAGRQFDMPAVI